MLKGKWTCSRFHFDSTLHEAGAASTEYGLPVACAIASRTALVLICCAIFQGADRGRF